MEAIVGAARHQVCEHVGCCGIAAVVLFSTPNQKQGLCNIALAGAGIPRKHKPLLTPYKVQLCKLHYLGFVYAGLEDKVEVRKQFPFRQSRFSDLTFYFSLYECICLYSKQSLKKFCRRKCFLRGFGKFLFQDLLNTVKLQCL